MENPLFKYPKTITDDASGVEIPSPKYEACVEGLMYGIWLFAWWKDGVQYVGTSGKTLEEAYKELEVA